jgi:hypothetical protein
MRATYPGGLISACSAVNSGCTAGADHHRTLTRFRIGLHAAQ